MRISLSLATARYRALPRAVERDNRRAHIALPGGHVLHVARVVYKTTSHQTRCHMRRSTIGSVDLTIANGA